MVKVFEIYCYICAGIISIGILAGLVGLAINLVAYAIESCIGFKTFNKVLKLYRQQKDVILKEEDLKEK